MDEEELEAWYDSQKELHFEKLTFDLEQKKIPADAAEKQFQQAMEKLHKDYENRFLKVQQSQKKKQAFNAKLQNMKAHLKEQIEAVRKKLKVSGKEK